MDERFADTANSNNPVTRAIGPGTTQTSMTLFDRIGGEKILDQIVTDVYNDMRGDKEIGKLFARFRLERLKDRTVDYLRGEWGGPEPYKGSDFGSPTPTRDLMFKNMYLKHSEKLAAAAGGDGWGKPSANPNAQAEADKKKKEEEEKQKAEAAAKQKAEEEAKKAKAEAAKKKKQAAEQQKTSGETSQSTKEPSDDDDAPEKTRDRSKSRKGTQASQAAANRAFNFEPHEDCPPAQLPGSAPSGEEMMCRMSRPCLGVVVN
eukprot:CAMPEP_0206586222 /NCGR_PEP_ID=MMETSP0325_2-20121206/36890_1 /ASSEMBLY_ACC=CAM_ASM_000347 /TAXON_ID=2866 /ORGANISM="Crypthecodinium cohnii, Strain Seligo" /LENGTH=260 /DNA_ID=CAMNT_0054093931 /DNA_START=10 /DNA_END=793 /DNA_ORIENTATION=+